jgi:serine/threonine-protein kinase
MGNNLLNNRYKILKSLGRGGFGETFLAIDTQMPSQRQCVIKKLNPAVQSSVLPDWLRERFAREAAILEELGENHPQIPQLYAYFNQGGEFYFVQEYIPGLTLSEAQQQRGNFSEEEVKKLLCQILPILEYIHSRGIIHRNIKPENIILRQGDNLPVLIDFGIVKETVATWVQEESHTPYSLALGTPGYMASEQAAGRPVYASDLYSLGLTAIFLLTGKAPQALETDSQTGEFIFPPAAVSSNLAEVLEQAIRFHPRERFSSDRQMLAALGKEPSSTATLVVAPPAPGRSVKPKKGINWWKWLFSLVLFAGASVGGFLLGFKTFFPQEQPQPEPTPEEPQEIFPPTPSPTPIPTPIPSPEPTPEVLPEPEPTPEVVPEPEPEVVPEPTPEIVPEPEPEETPIPEVTPTPREEITPIPEASPESIPIPVEPPPEEESAPSNEG